MADNQKTDKKTEKKDKNQKPNIFKRLVNFFTNLKSELKRVVWPDRKKLVQSTVTVLVICILAGITLFIVDSVLGGILNGIGFYDVKATSAPTTQVTTTVSTTAETTAATTTSTSSAG